MSKKKKLCDSRKGDMAEYYAVTWLWDNGYEVFKNCGCTGLADLIALKDGQTTLVDVKTAQPQLHKKTGNNFTKCCSRTPEQIKAGVQLLQFNSVDRSLYFTKHRDKKYD
jgi:hypothetical protein